MVVLGQAGPGAAKRGFGYESVNRLKTTCGRPGTRVGYPENPVPSASEMLRVSVFQDLKRFMNLNAAEPSKDVFEVLAIEVKLKNML